MHAKDAQLMTLLLSTFRMRFIFEGPAQRQSGVADSTFTSRAGTAKFATTFI